MHTKIRKLRNNRTFLIILVGLLSIGLILPSFIGIFAAIFS